MRGDSSTLRTAGPQAPCTQPANAGENPAPRSTIKGLSADDRLEIERLASSMKRPTPGKISAKLGANVSTVAWFMIRNGLVQRTVTYGGPDSYVQAGRLVHRYKREHDERLCQLRREGKNPREIAAAITAEFGIQRSTHSVHVRLTMLAAYEGGPEA